jgi:(2Fe-2S) ferredoxin
VRHLFICTNTVASGKPACGKRGGDELITAIQQELLARQATGVTVTPCGCLGPCFDGPNAVVYPDAVWYGELAVEDARAIVEHLLTGAVHAAKCRPRPG